MEISKASNQSFIKRLLITLIADICITLVLLFCYALVLTLTDITDASMSIVANVILTVAISLSTIIGCKRLGKFNIPLGLLNGLIFSGILIILGIIQGESITFLILWFAKLSLGLVAGLTGGIISTVLKNKVLFRIPIISSVVMLLILSVFAYNSLLESDYASALINTPEAIEETINTQYKEIQELLAAEVNNSTKSAEATNFFNEYRTERDKLRCQEIELWEKVINNTNIDEAYKKIARDEINKTKALTENEKLIEEQILTKGYNDAIAFITVDTATVLIDSGNLTSSELTVIQDIITDKTGFKADNIKVMIKK
jgi:stage III sporulation protein AH